MNNIGNKFRCTDDFSNVSDQELKAYLEWLLDRVTKGNWESCLAGSVQICVDGDYLNKTLCSIDRDDSFAWQAEDLDVEDGDSGYGHLNLKLMAMSKELAKRLCDKID